MRKALIALNLLIAAASAALFGYTFVARDHLAGLAEDYVVEKTVEYATPAIELIEAALDLPIADLVPLATREAVRAEVDSFRRDPGEYVRALVAKGAAIPKPKHAFAEKVVKLKEDIQDYFEQTLAILVRDLRIFSGTNVVAALLAAWLAYVARGRWRNHVLGISVLLLAALAFQMYLFIDDLTFFRIIIRARVGWSYPLSVTVVFVYLYLRIGKNIQPGPVEPDPSGSRNPTAVR